MKPTFAVLMVAVAAYVSGSTMDRTVPTGHAYYDDTQYRKAAANFEPACRNNDAGACFWAGMSYEKLADIEGPFGCPASAKARWYFTRATTLSPGESLYRDTLFDFLVTSADCSPTALRAAEKILAATPVSNPNYDSMRRLLENQKRLSNSLDGRAERLFQFPSHLLSWLGMFGR